VRRYFKSRLWCWRLRCHDNISDTNWKIKHVCGKEIILFMIVLCKVYLYDCECFDLPFVTVW